MASGAVIANVGKTLVGMLEDRMGDLVTDDEIALASPGDEDPGDDYRLTLYLYDVTQNEHLSNDRARPESTGRPSGAALVLDLHYLLTAHPKDASGNETRTSRTAQQHRILGRAMQIMADNAIVRKPDLHEEIDPSETITITMESVSRGEFVDIWGTFTEVSYQPSIAYVVSPVVVDSQRPGTDSRVVEGTVNQFTYSSADDAEEDMRR